MDRLSVPEAAAQLGLSENALRKRIQRGTIEHYKDEGGRVFVYLSPEMPPTKTGQVGNQVDGHATDQDSDHVTDQDSHHVTDQDSHHVTDQDSGHATDQRRLIERLEGEVECLRREVEDWKDEARRKDAIMMTMAQRNPAIEEAAPEPREYDVSASEERSGADIPPEQEKSVSWWRRLFG